MLNTVLLSLVKTEKDISELLFGSEWKESYGKVSCVSELKPWFLILCSEII